MRDTKEYKIFDKELSKILLDEDINFRKLFPTLERNYTTKNK
jgi:hypothetical protein